MARLNSFDGASSFTLELLDWQVPPAQQRHHWDEWILCRVTLQSPEGVYAGTEPCLLSDEVPQILEGCFRIASGQSLQESLTFREPNLRLSFREDDVIRDMFRVHVHFHAFPLRQEGNGPTDISFLTDRRLINEFLAGLRAAVRRFPVRFPPERGEADG